MKSLNNISNVYFLGIGGIGMSALARYFNSKEKFVSGYDKTPTPLTDLLQQEGIAVHFEDNIELIDKNADIVVYTPAIPKNHTEFNYFKANSFSLMKRSEVLGLITSANYNIAVAGTHGKSTTSCMVAHILRDSGFGCNAFLGAIAANYNTNYWSNRKEVAVTEADEFDRSFLQLHPDVAVVTSMDPDHLDIYGTPQNLEEAFIDFTRNIRGEGVLFYNEKLTRAAELHGHKKYSYGINSTAAQLNATNIRAENGHYIFDVVMPDGKIISDCTLNMGGLHNVENATVAAGIAHYLGIEDEKIKLAIASFKGVKRRFEYIISTDELVMIDDYAHHPEELRALIEGAKHMFPNRKYTVVFQPHLYSRTNDLADGFARVLSTVDETILLPIYPARELPMPGVESEMILERMSLQNKQVMQKQELLEWFKSNTPDVLITAGAGNIDAMVQPIKEILLNNG